MASFHLLNKNSPAINAESVGARNVNIPIDVAGLIYGTLNPKINPETVPYKGPNRGAVKLESKTLEKVIETPTPGIGYIIKKLTDNRRAVQIAINAIFMLENNPWLFFSTNLLVTMRLIAV